MNTSCKYVAALVCSLAAFVSAPARADDEAKGRLHDAWSDILAAQENVLTPQQFAKLNNIAYQAAVVRVCKGFELDNSKFETHLGEALSAPNNNLTEEELNTHASFVLVEFGMRIGVFIAEGNAHEASFCDNAAKLKTHAEVPNIWK